jgi:stage III sporulation protein AG
MDKKRKKNVKPNKFQYLVLVLCIGAACILAGNSLFNSNKAVSTVSIANNKSTNSNIVSVSGSNKNSENNSILNEEQQYEDSLKSSLEEMLGVKDVTVLVDLDSSDQQILATNKTIQKQTTEESDKSGGHQNIQSDSINEKPVIENGNNQGPIVVETKKPVIRGVLVVAKGAEDIEVKKSIVEAVTRVLDVPSFRVAVEPRK